MARQKMIKSKVVIVLVEPENPDNIGAVARAMKNMGLKELRLVKPVKEWRVKGRKLAVAAADVLQRAKSYRTLDAAIAESHVVIGTTRRGGPRRGFFLSFKNFLAKIKKESVYKEVAILFGRESKGLDNEAITKCDWVTTLPVHRDYPSINLAQAVMIVVFSLFQQVAKKADLAEYQHTAAVPRRGTAKSRVTKKVRETNFLKKKEVETVLDHFEEALMVLGYGRKGGDLIPRIRNTFDSLLKRNGLLQSEAQMLKGIVRQIKEKSASRH